MGAARGAKNPHDLPNIAPMTPVEVRKASLVEAVERTIAEARASLAEARAFVRERSHFEDLLPRESGIRSAHTSASDLEREALAYAQSLPRKSTPAPSPELHGLLVRVETARNAATEELPEETFDGDPLASAVLAAAPTEADLAHLLATGHAEEARRRVARLEALLAAARAGVTPGSLDRDAFRAPEGSFASFVATRPVPFAQRFARPIADPVRPRPALPISLPSVRYYGKELRGALPPSKITGGAQVLGPPRNPPTVADRRMVAHGIVEYDRALPDTAIASFDLVPLHATPQDAARDIVDLAVARGVLNYVQEYEESGMGGETAAITAARTLSERAGFRLSGQYSDDDLRPFLRAYMISRGMLAAPFSERFGAGAPEPIDASTQFSRAANYAMARYRRTMASLKTIAPLKADAFRKRLGFPNWETEFHKAKTLPAINALLKRLDAIDAEVAPLAASYVPTPLTSFKAIVDWYQNELPNYYKITPADFRERVTIDRGSGHPIVLTPAAMGALPIGRLLANRWWEAEPYEYAVRSALDAAIAAARQAGTRRDQPIPVTVRFHGIAEPTHLVARVVGDEIVLDVPSRFGAGGAEELRPRLNEPAPTVVQPRMANEIEVTLSDAWSRLTRFGLRVGSPDVGMSRIQLIGDAATWGKVRDYVASYRENAKGPNRASATAALQRIDHALR